MHHEYFTMNQFYLELRKINDFKNHSISNISHGTSNAGTIVDNHVANKSYNDSPSENKRFGCVLSTVFNDQNNEFDTSILRKLDSLAVNRSPTADNEVSIRKHDDDRLVEGTVCRNIQPLKTI